MGAGIFEAVEEAHFRSGSDSSALSGGLGGFLVRFLVGNAGVCNEVGSSKIVVDLKDCWIWWKPKIMGL